MVTRWETTYEERRECEVKYKDDCHTINVEKTTYEDVTKEVRELQA